MPNEEDKKTAVPEVQPKEEKDKYNALLAGVIFFMLLIIVLWVMNLRTMLAAVPKKHNDDLNIDKISQELQQAFNKTGAEINQLKNIDPADLQKYKARLATTSSVGAASTTIEK
jgi:hypothetical protein